MNLSGKEIAVLQELAARYAEIAALPAQHEKRDEWRAFNDGSMHKPMVLIDQLPWNELGVDESLHNQVQDAYWRAVETELRQTIYKWTHLPVDMVVNSYLALPRPIQNTGWGLIPDDDRRMLDPHTTAASRHYNCLINDFDDIERIQMPQVSLDAAREAEIIETAQRVFAGILPYRMTGTFLHLGVWDRISEWMGVENCYINLIDRPELMHAIISRLTDGL
ncbi:MAG: hypothetical protein ACOYI5_07860, partial [Christensenellales bacterium]